jgi:hypothetical protein
MFEKQAELDAQVDALYKVVKGRIDWNNLIPICLELAQELEGMSHLKGSQRLDLLQKTLKFAANDSDSGLDDESKKVTLMFIDNVLPIAMSAAVLASKSPIAAQVQSACCPCFSLKK